MPKPARRARQVKVESFVDWVWAVPLHHPSEIERGGRVLHRLKGVPRAGRRLVLLRSYVGEQVPDLISV